MTEETAEVDLPTTGPLVDFLSAVSESLSEGFRELGGLAPLLFVVPAVEDPHVVGVPFEDYDTDADRHRMSSWIREHLERCSAVRYAFAIEARNPHEQEPSMISVEAAEYGAAISGVREIIRPKNGKPHLGALQPINSQGFFRGKLLPERRLQ